MECAVLGGAPGVMLGYCFALTGKIFVGGGGGGHFEWL